MKIYMKKIIITGLFVLSNFAAAQDTSDNPYVYETQNEEAEADYPGNPADPDPVPIDQYIPYLLLTAMGMVVVFSKKKKIV